MFIQKKYIPTPWKIIGNSKGEGVFQAKVLEAKYETKLEFPGGWGAKQKPSGGGAEYG